MVHMLETLKDKIGAQCAEWVEQAQRNKQEGPGNQEVEVDISRAFYHLFCENIIFILFGEDICHEFTVKIHMRQDHSGAKPLVTKDINIGDSLDEVFE